MERPLRSRITVAAVATCVGVLLGIGVIPGQWLDAGQSPRLWTLASGCGLMAAAECGRLRARVNDVFVDLTWSEAAFILVCALVPAGWVPAAVLVGVCGAHTFLGLLDRKRTTQMILDAGSTLTIASAVGILVTRAISPIYGHPLTARATIALLIGAIVYSLIALYLIVLRVIKDSGEPVKAIFFRLLAGKLFMLIGNIAIGILIVAIDWNSREWLILLLPPAAWLLHQAYGYRLRLDGEQWTWRLFSDITAGLNRLNEREVAHAAILGALRLFHVMVVEVRIYDQGKRAYFGNNKGLIVDSYLRKQDLPGKRTNYSTESRPLLVGGSQIGEIRMYLRRPIRLSRQERHMLAAYGDALAAALHNATAHRELRSISERRLFEAVHDPLTKIANRSALLDKGSELLHGLPPEAFITFMLFDIDHFKEVNNTLGHAAGDELLQIIAERLQSAVDVDEILARLGGDEFAIVTTQMGPLAVDAEDMEAELVKHMVTRAQGLAGDVAIPARVSGVTLSVETSVGVVVAVAGEVDMTELLRRGDIAMYQAKRGADPVAWYMPERDEVDVDRLALLAEIRTALFDADQFIVVFQPMVCLKTEDFVGVEVLVRWNHPRRGLLYPREFIEIIDHSELVGVFARHTLEKALKIAQKWSQSGVDIGISINISDRVLLDHSFVDDVSDLLDQYGVVAHRLTLEIRESVILVEATGVERILAAVRDRGIRLCVDDFGSGFSSLTFLAKVPVDEIKIDKIFISRMVESAESAAIVRTTVDLARQLGIQVVAEGVETAEQRQALSSLGCIVAQGYYFHPPLSPEDISAVFAGRHSELR